MLCGRAVRPALPLCPGLSYTSFSIDGLRTDADEVTTIGALQVCCNVCNTGEQPGEDVVMLFANFFGTRVTRPVLSLVGFKKVYLEPGECKTVCFELSMSQFGYYDEDMEFVVEPGDLTLYASDTSKELACSKAMRIGGEKVGVLGKRSYTCPARIDIDDKL